MILLSVLQMNDPVIRDAVIDDAGILHNMENFCFSDPWSLDYVEKLIKNPSVRFLIAEENDVPVGYAGIIIICDECEILNVAVMPEHRRSGVARRLMEHIIGICRTSGVSSLFLEHRKSNTAAAALYESLGFTEYAVRRRYYTSPTEDAILRKLTL